MSSNRSVALKESSPIPPPPSNWSVPLTSSNVSTAIVYELELESRPDLNVIRSTISTLLHLHRLGNSATEVIVILTSLGGSASEYGEASSLLCRLSEEPGLTLTIFVPTAAASGGYMCASASSPGRLFCSRFAMLGSIGVVGSILNYRDALHKLGVKSVEFKSGSDKAPLSAISEVTEAGRATVMRGLKAVHDEFRDLVLERRPGINISKVGEGDVYLGLEAKRLRLCDGVFEVRASKERKTGEARGAKRRYFRT